MSEAFRVPFNELKCGAIASMLRESYRGWQEYDRWVNQWSDYDAEVFEYPDTVGRCGFATRTEGVLVGFISWDPRSRPCVTIGHNCILPSFRNQGYGSWQLKCAIGILSERGFTQARASTGDDEFFAFARKMYENNGFQRCEPYLKDRSDLVYYSREL